MKIEKGEYLARNGERVTVLEVKEGSTFTVKGHKWRIFRGKYKPKDFSTWKINGQHNAVGVSEWDIVAKFKG